MEYKKKEEKERDILIPILIVGAGILIWWLLRRKPTPPPQGAPVGGYLIFGIRNWDKSLMIPYEAPPFPDKVLGIGLTNCGYMAVRDWTLTGISVKLNRPAPTQLDYVVKIDNSEYEGITIEKGQLGGYRDLSINANAGSVINLELEYSAGPGEEDPIEAGLGMTVILEFIRR